MGIITKTAIKIAAPLPHIEKYQRYKFLGPHPDDIEIGAGATAARLSSEGKAIKFIICADGRYGTDNYNKPVTPDELIEIRRNEAESSARILGVNDVIFLDFCDGGFYEQRELIGAIIREIGSFQPEVIFAPDPDVITECHPDHINVGMAAKQAAVLCGNPGICQRYGAEPHGGLKALALYMTGRPNRYAAISKDDFEKQQRAIFECHRSQYPAGSDASSALRLYLNIRSIDMGMRALSGRAEGFRVMGPVHMHCLPD